MSSGQPMRSDLVHVHAHTIDDLPVGRGARKIPTNDLLTDNFLAPNEFYVDTTAPATPPSDSRVVPTITMAFQRADGLVGAGVDLLIRFREGQTHVWNVATTAVTPTDRDIFCYVEGQRDTGVVQATFPTGVISFVGAGLPDAGGVNRPQITFRNLVISGDAAKSNLLILRGWRVSFQECLMADFGIRAIPAGGVTGIDIALDGCVDSGASLAGNKNPFIFESAGVVAVMSTLRFTRCRLTAVLNGAALNSWIELDGLWTVTFEGCNNRIHWTSNADPAIGLAATSAAIVQQINTDWSFSDDGVVVDYFFAGNAGTALFSSANSRAAYAQSVTGSRFTWCEVAGNAFAGSRFPDLAGGFGVADTKGAYRVPGGPVITGDFTAGALCEDPSARIAAYGGPGGWLNQDHQERNLFYGHGCNAYMSATGVGVGVTIPMNLMHHKGLLPPAFIPITNNNTVVAFEAHIVAKGQGVGVESAYFIVQGLAYKNAAGVVTVNVTAPFALTTEVYNTDTGVPGGMTAIAAPHGGGLGVEFNVSGVAAPKTELTDWRAAIRWLVLN